MTPVENLKVVVDVEFGERVTVVLFGETVIGPENLANRLTVPFKLSMLVSDIVEFPLPPCGIDRK